MRPLPRLLALVLVLSAPAEQEGPLPLPEGLHAARVRSGVLHLRTENGEDLPGTYRLESGWYFTAAGYERLMVTTSDLQVRVGVAEARAAAAVEQADTARRALAELDLRLEKALVRADGCGQLAAATCAAAAAATAGYSPVTLYVVGGLCLLVGFGLGLLFVVLERVRARG